MENLKENIILALQEVYDPEIPINVYDLGLIYEINIKDNSNIHILMSLTSPTCPTADFIKEMIHDAVISVEGVKSCDIELTFEPMWSPDKVSEYAKEELGISDSSFKKTEDLTLQNTFTNEDESKYISENICFNCGITDDKRPVIECFYMGDKTKICSKCLSKFD